MMRLMRLKIIHLFDLKASNVTLFYVCHFSPTYPTI